MNRHPDPAYLDETDVTLVDHRAGDRWDLELLEPEGFDQGLDARPTEPDLSCHGPAPRRASTIREDTVDRAFRTLLRAPSEPEPLPEIPTGPAQRPADDPVLGPALGPALGHRAPRLTLTAESLREKRRVWKRGATETRRNLAERKGEREALARVLAMARPAVKTQARAHRAAYPRLRASTQERQERQGRQGQ